jgi:hypothetical protein
MLRVLIGATLISSTPAFGQYAPNTLDYAVWKGTIAAQRGRDRDGAGE